MISEQEYLNIKEMISYLERERDEATGAYKQTLATLKKEFKCDNLGEAEKLLEKLEREKEEYEAQFKTELKSFKERFGKQIRNLQVGPHPLRRTASGSKKPKGERDRPDYRP